MEFDRSRKGILKSLGLQKRPTGTEDCDPGRLKLHYEVLSAKGRVVWGAVTHANLQLFSPGNQDFPGVVTYSPDPHYNDHPQDLAATAQACFALKNTIPANEEFHPIADRLTDEFDSTPKLAIPKALADNREAFLGPVMFHRSRLPLATLATRIFPLVIAPQASELTMVLPLKYWPQSIRHDWGEIDQILASSHVNSRALHVVRNTRKRPREEFVPDWDVDTTPISITSAAVKQLHHFMQDIAPSSKIMLEVVIEPNGFNRICFIDRLDPELQETFVSSGIEVAILKEQRRRLRGTVLDFDCTSFQAGFILRFP